MQGECRLQGGNGGHQEKPQLFSLTMWLFLPDVQIEGVLLLISSFI
jgi:hypothetical protein